MIGSLVKFSCNKRSLYFPALPLYTHFNGHVGFVTSYSKIEETGDEYICVRWQQPVQLHGRDFVTWSDFNLLNFEILNEIWSNKIGSRV